MFGSSGSPGLARSRRHGWFAAAAAGVLVVGTVASAPSASAGPEPAAHVDGAVTSALATHGSAEFLVHLNQTADLSATTGLATKTAKASHVHQQLTTVANRSQADLRAMLDARGVDYTPYWISNTIHVTAGSQALVDDLATHPDVASIQPNREYPLIEPVVQPSTDDPGINVVEWGVANINADDVWDQFNVRGEGIVVANIDTGVQFDHPALVDQYRGTATGSHDHNWFDPANICPTTAPCDNNGHGTHTMGTMVGDDGGSNQVGVAPRAQWIAAKGCESNSCSSGSLLASGQWMIAPTEIGGGNPDPSMAPDVVNNSWGGGRGDTWYQATIDAWVNAGIFPMFSIGNNGPSCGTAGSPGDNIPAYGIGAYDISNNIANFSSRGPSGVDPSEIKPNASAPGVNVRSSVPTNGYANASGTSMASPHASGIVALVWSAAPDFQGDISATRTLLDNTARDTSDLQCGGTADDNNVFGEGRLDALAAVTQATGGGGDGVTADFTFNCVKQQGNRTCTFDGSGSTGDVVSWSWDFDDGGTGSGEVVSHNYQGGKDRNVTLTVTGAGGDTDSTTQAVPVP